MNGCINCRQAEQSGVNPLCKACDDTLSQYAPVLVQVPSDNKIFWDSKPRVDTNSLDNILPSFDTVTDQFTAQWLHPTGCPTVHAVYRVIGSQQSWSMYNSYRYVASPIIVKARETELTMAGITATSWSTMVSSRLVGSTSETNVYCGTAHGECAVWAILGTPRFARTRVARCARSSVVRLTFPKLRRTRIGRGLGLGYTLHPYRPSRSTEAAEDRNIEVDGCFLGQTIIRRTSVPRTTR